MKISLNLMKKAMKAAERDDMSGYCITCERRRSHCEPDARKYPCDKCKTDTVYGAEEIVLGGTVVRK